MIGVPVPVPVPVPVGQWPPLTSTKMTAIQIATMVNPSGAV
ncbi:MAG: hypothetical protein ACM30G_03655 [Micromonosporaceae bacterium]